MRSASQMRNLICSALYVVPSTSRRRPRHHQLAEGVVYKEAEGEGRPVHFYIRPRDDDTDVIVVSCVRLNKQPATEYLLQACFEYETSEGHLGCYSSTNLLLAVAIANGRGYHIAFLYRFGGVRARTRRRRTTRGPSGTNTLKS